MKNEFNECSRNFESHWPISKWKHLKNWKNVLRNKGFITGNYSEKVSGFFNLTIYFIALTGVMNILYFQFFNEINPFIYSAMCVLFPIVATTTVKSSWILSQKIQQFFFNEREIAIIAIGGILTFIISFAA